MVLPSSSDVSTVGPVISTLWLLIGQHYTLLSFHWIIIHLHFFKRIIIVNWHLYPKSIKINFSGGVGGGGGAYEITTMKFLQDKRL